MSDALPEPLIATLHILADAARELEDPWWVFGGAAMALAGLDDLHVPDVDVMASPRDARRLLDALHGQPLADPGEGRLRARVTVLETRRSRSRPGSRWRWKASSFRSRPSPNRSPSVACSDDPRTCNAPRGWRP